MNLLQLVTLPRSACDWDSPGPANQDPNHLTPDITPDTDMTERILSQKVPSVAFDGELRKKI